MMVDVGMVFIPKCNNVSGTKRLMEMEEKKIMQKLSPCSLHFYFELLKMIPLRFRGIGLLSSQAILPNLLGLLKHSVKCATFDEIPERISYNCMRRVIIADVVVSPLTSQEMKKIRKRHRHRIVNW